MPYVLSGAESCGPDQEWAPDVEYKGIKGQCIPKGSRPDWTDVAKSVIKYGLGSKKNGSTGSGGGAGYRPQTQDNTLVYAAVGAAALLTVILLTRD